MTKRCSRCGKDYQTFSNLSKYCDECRNEIKKENLEAYRFCFGSSGRKEETMMYSPYGSAAYFWECNS